MRQRRIAIAGPGIEGARRAFAHPTGYIPPIAQTIFHCSGVTGCTERREYFASAMSASRGSALTAASVTGFGNGFTALTVDRDEDLLLVGRIGIGFAYHLHDADDLLLLAGVIEQRLALPASSSSGCPWR